MLDHPQILHPSCTTEVFPLYPVSEACQGSMEQGALDDSLYQASPNSLKSAENVEQ